MIRFLKHYDFTLLITPLILAAFGIVMIYSASMVSAVVDGLEGTHFLVKQLQWFFVGLFCFIFFSIVPYQKYQFVIQQIIFICLGLLVGVLLFGENINNSKSWFVTPFFSLQPAEFVKLGLIIYLASVYSKKQAYINEFYRGVLPPLIIMVIILALIVAQPDIGTAAIIFLIASSVIFSSGIKYKHLFLLIAIGVILLAFTIPNMVTDVRIARFTGAYKPFETPDSDGYHLIQSYLAIGVGGLTGEGLGQSVQKLGYLWGAHTDFIMAIIAEELGFVGVVIVIGLLITIVLRGIFIARKCEDSFGALLAIGISSMVGIQAFINLGSISGILPITGVPLPFVSYGGSSLIVLMLSMGILNNIAKQVKKKEREPISVQPEQMRERNVFMNRRGSTW
ncbi:FtsW/RodA/SpoVE family cell cycle protein [Virgibacillus sp. W0430]|uniref:FtsW/RodA/SpoVE family cell cycle protein n=1 Tax=Virgibacillus sp. W0430 TaxID=3391580 RepID=UPI003F471313